MSNMTWVMAQGVSSVNAKATIKLHHFLSSIERRDDVINELSEVLQKNGKTVDPVVVEALADISMSRKKWSAKRLRDLYTGKKVFRILVALHGLSRGYGSVEDSVLAIFKKMAEAGNERRQGTFHGVVGELEQKSNLFWWREQED